MYSSNEDAGTTSITDVGTGAVRATLPVGIEPEGVAINPDGRWVYVTAETSNTVSVIDTRTDEVIANFRVDVRPRAGTFAPTGLRAYVTNEISGTVSVVDAATHEVIETIELEGGEAKPVGVSVSPDGTRVYVANGHAGTVSVIDHDEPGARKHRSRQTPVGDRGQRRRDPRLHRERCLGRRLGDRHRHASGGRDDSGGRGAMGRGDYPLKTRGFRAARRPHGCREMPEQPSVRAPNAAGSRTREHEHAGRSGPG